MEYFWMEILNFLLVSMKIFKLKTTFQLHRSFALVGAAASFCEALAEQKIQRNTRPAGERPKKSKKSKNCLKIVTFSFADK